MPESAAAPSGATAATFDAAAASTLDPAAAATFDPAAAARTAAGDVTAALGVAQAAGRALRAADTAAVLAALAELGRADLTVARVVEPHLDAHHILREAGVAPADGAWGVFAAEAPGAVVRAELGGATEPGSAANWTLSGTKAWCSLAGVLDHALVTAETPAGRRLFAVDLRHRGVTVTDVAWVARGLAAVTSAPVHFDQVPARPVGEAGWYLRRPGFSWGGIRVAACWVGGATAVAAHLRASLAARARAGAGRSDAGLPDAGRSDPLREANLGRADVAVWSARLALRHAAAQIDSGDATGLAGELLAARVRAVAADAVETVLRESGHALGPAPLAFEEEHARRVADLELYVRQHHAERDLASLAGLLLAQPGPGEAAMPPAPGAARLHPEGRR